MKKENVTLFLFVAVIVILAELIGINVIPVGKVSLTLLPLVFSVLLTMIIGLPAFRKGLIKKIYTKGNVKFSAENLLYVTLPLMAHYGSAVAPRIREVFDVGWILIFQELGNLGTIIIGLPVAILLGLKREAIGATLGLGREGELAYISEKYTLNSPEGRGVLSVYLTGTLFGTIFFSLLAPLFLSLGFDYRALAMSAGVGSASMMTAATSSLIAIYPDQEAIILSYASASQLLTSFLGMYSMLFIAIPLQRHMYRILTRRSKHV